MRRALAVGAALSITLLFLPTSAHAGGFCMGYSDEEGFLDAAGTEVRMANNCFSPTVIRVEPGDSVTWVNADPEIHGVGGAVGSFGDAHAEIAKEASVTYRFDDEGVFPYVCIFHPGMTGAVVVGDGQGAAGAGIGTVATEEEPPAPRPATQPSAAEDDGSNVALAVALGIALVLLAAAIAALTRRARPREAITTP